jgi:hypothetical protein
VQLKNKQQQHSIMQLESFFAEGFLTAKFYSSLSFELS